MEATKKKHQASRDDYFDRLERLSVIFENLKAHYNWGDKALMNEKLLFDVVKSYYDDLERFKHYSNSILADEYKKAAYTTKWISKIRPIQILSQKGDKKNIQLITSNEIFAIVAGLNHLEIRINQIPKEYLTSLFYACRYRIISGKQMTREMMLLKKLVQCTTKTDKS